MFTKALAAANLTTVDISPALSDLLACKDPEEIKKAKRAAYLAATALQKYAVPQFESEPLPHVELKQPASDCRLKCSAQG